MYIREKRAEAQQDFNSPFEWQETEIRIFDTQEEKRKAKKDDYWLTNN